jgi:hypothetical protein
MSLNDLSLKLICPSILSYKDKYVTYEDHLSSFQEFKKRDIVSENFLFKLYIYNLFQLFFSGKKLSLDSEEEKMISHFIHKKETDIKSLSKFWVSLVGEFSQIESSISGTMYHGVKVSNKLFNKEHLSYSYTIEGLSISESGVTIYTVTPYPFEYKDMELNIKNLLLIDFFQSSNSLKFKGLVDIGICYNGGLPKISKRMISRSSLLDESIKTIKSKTSTLNNLSPSRCLGCSYVDSCSISQKLNGSK